MWLREEDETSLLTLDHLSFGNLGSIHKSNLEHRDRRQSVVVAVYLRQRSSITLQ
jgi:hypothetical protein